MNILALYLYIINIFSYFYMRYDKQCANKNMRRVAEFTFFYIALAGGGLGIVIGSHTFNHKTQKYLFVKTIPVITVAEALIFALLFIFIGV